MSLGNRIRSERKKKGYSQEDLAKQIGITRQAIQKWEKDENEPCLNDLVTLSKIFGVSLNYLVDGENEKEGEEPPNSEKEKTTFNIPLMIILTITLVTSIVFFLLLVIWSFQHQQPLNGTQMALWWYIPFLNGTNFPFQVLLLISIAGIVLSILFLIKRGKK